MPQNFYRKFKLEQEIDRLLDFSKNRINNFSPQKKYTHQLLDKNSNYWEWPTNEISECCIKELLNYLEERHQLPVNTPKTSVALWEYGKGDLLPPHTDLKISLSGTIVISLIGDFETRFHNEAKDDEVISRIVYGPGDYVVLNNTVVRHSGRPLSDYRLALVVFIDPDYDLTQFWST